MQCKICGGGLVYLGVLGNLFHFKCRDCGMTFHIAREDIPEEALEELAPL